jgi:hypothetical protein
MAGQSLWSILHRFQWLNRLPAAALMPALDDAIPDEVPFDFDLRNGLSFNATTLAPRLGVARRTLRASVLAIEDDVARALCADVLRFCPQCLRSGLHATLHQCVLVDVCLAHRQRLRTRCPQCDSPIPYRFDALAAVHPYACPLCDTLLIPALVQPAGRPGHWSAAQHARLISAQRLVERHAVGLRLPVRPFGISVAQHAKPVLARVAFLRRLFHVAGMEVRVARDEILAARRLAVRWLASAQHIKPAEILSYPQNNWRRLGRNFIELEWDYRRAVSALHSRGAEPEASLKMRPTSHAVGLRDRATTLFRMAWEGVQHSQHLDQTIHPAFGIAVWLALADVQSIDSTDPRLSARIHFREALETVLAHAIVWARRFHSTTIPPQMGQLLLPEIFDLARSQRFDKRNL